jgi:hypothetical protein
VVALLAVGVWYGRGAALSRSGAKAQGVGGLVAPRTNETPPIASSHAADPEPPPASVASASPTPIPSSVSTVSPPPRSQARVPPSSARRAVCKVVPIVKSDGTTDFVERCE